MTGIAFGSLDIPKISMGNTPIVKVSMGDTIVWPAGSKPPVTIDLWGADSSESNTLTFSNFAGTLMVGDFMLFISHKKSPSVQGTPFDTPPTGFTDSAPSATQESSCLAVSWKIADQSDIDRGGLTGYATGNTFTDSIVIYVRGYDENSQPTPFGTQQRLFRVVRALSTDPASVSITDAASGGNNTLSFTVGVYASTASVSTRTWTGRAITIGHNTAQLRLYVKARQNIPSDTTTTVDMGDNGENFLGGYIFKLGPAP